MKALTLRPCWAAAILFKDKTVECRSWKTSFRGDLLITSGAYKYIDSEGLPVSCACAVVKLADIVPFKKEHMKKACMEFMPEQSFAWLLENIRPVKPFKVSGKLRLFEVNEPIEFLEDTSEEAIEKIFTPFVYR